MADLTDGARIELWVRVRQSRAPCARAAMWAMCMRRHINHRDDNTTSHCEGYHSAIKGHIRARGSENMRLDKLVHFLLTVVSVMYTYRRLVAFDSASSTRLSPSDS